MDKRNLSGFSADTEVLTRTQGWIGFDRLTCFDEVATRSPDGRFEWQHPESVTAERHDGPVLHLRSQVFDLILAPEHPLPLLRRGQRGQPDSVNPVFRPVSWFCDMPSRGKWWRIPTTSTWEGTAPESVVIPAAERRRGRHHPARELRFSAEAWSRFLGWFLSEGWLATRDRNVVGVSQTTERHKPEIRSVLGSMGVDDLVREDPAGFVFHHGPLAELLRRTCYMSAEHRAWTKCVPPQVKGYPQDLLAEMFAAMMRGDGHVEKTGLRRYVTTSKVLADDVTEVLQKMGSQGWHDILPVPARRATPGPRGRRPQYRVAARPGNASNTPVPTETRYSGLLYGIAAPNMTVYVRRNGRTAWCGA